MQLQISKLRAHELCIFLSCSPLEIKNPSDYLKLQKFRKLVEKENGEFEEKMKGYKEKREKEAKPFREALEQLKFDQEALKEKAKEFELQLVSIMEQDTKELNEYVEQHGKDFLTIDIDSEELSQARKLFEKVVKINDIEVNYGAKMWPEIESYVEIAALLGIS